MTREQRLAAVFVELADTLVAEFDLIDFLYTLADRSVELLDADAAGLMLADQRGQLRVLASTTEEARILELFQLQGSAGPCLDCYVSGRPVVNVDPVEAKRRWPGFYPAATAAGYQSVHALPLRVRQQVIGALNLFCSRPVTLGENDLAVGQAMSDIATIGLLQERAIRQQEVLAEQLQGALNGRITIEQAKGVLAERARIDVRDAFIWMREYACSQHTSLVLVAAEVIDGGIDTAELEAN